jgi:hypothetical protein
MESIISFNTIYITLICKDPETHFDVTNYRPISLINIDVKILSKLICKRMSLVCANIKPSGPGDLSLSISLMESIISFNTIGSSQTCLSKSSNISKLICKRMSLVCANIIGIDQTCAIRGRSILDNGHLHRNIIDYCNQKNVKCAFISFDRINFSYKWF